MAYIKSYALVGFQVLPFDNKRKIGDFGEQMQITLGTYKPPIQNQDPAVLDGILKTKISNLIKGADGSIKRDQIITVLTKEGYETPERKVRQIIEQLINEDGYAIQSSEDGYQLITNAEQLKTAIKYLKNKAFPLFERANNLKKNFYKDKSIQLSFEEFFTD